MGRRRLTETELRLSRWLCALAIAKVLFTDQGYHTRYLQEIEVYLKEVVHEQEAPLQGE